MILYSCCFFQFPENCRKRNLFLSSSFSWAICYGKHSKLHIYIQVCNSKAQNNPKGKITKTNKLSLCRLIPIYSGSEIHFLISTFYIVGIQLLFFQITICVISPFIFLVVCFHNTFFSCIFLFALSIRFPLFLFVLSTYTRFIGTYTYSM